jgi:hypothetical protein
VLAADAYFQIPAGFSAFGNRHVHQPAHALAVERLEGVLRQDALTCFHSKSQLALYKNEMATIIEV